MKKSAVLTTRLSRWQKGSPTKLGVTPFPRLTLSLSLVGVLILVLSVTASAHINGVFPSDWTSGGQGFTLRIVGTDFDESDTLIVFFNGTNVITRLNSSTELEATIPASLVNINPGIVQVTLAGFNSVDFTIRPRPTITTSSPLPDGALSVPYSQRLEFSGGAQSQTVATWSGFPLPPGLSIGRIERNGIISGTPTTVGIFAFSVRVTDFAGVSASKDFSITIRQPPPPCPPSTISISEESHVYDETGGFIELSVTAPGDCSWSAAASSTWISFPDGTFRIGSGAMGYEVDQNSGFWRQGYISFNGGPVHHVFQNGPCPLELICHFIDNDGCPKTLSQSRNFRDEVLAHTPHGRRYKQLYYQFSREAVSIMMLNPMLIIRSRETIERYRAVLDSMIKGEQVTLTQGDIEEIDSFLNAFAKKGSAELKETIKGLCKDLRDLDVNREFNITVIDGPKRERRTQGILQIIEQTGMMIAPLGLFWLCGYGASRRHKKQSKGATSPSRASLGGLTR